ncbi:hypothetical protein J3R74_002862 [Puniceicoccus vermicola]
MKILQTFLFSITLAFGASPLGASMSLTFDTSNFSDTSDLWVTFAGASSDMVYDSGGSNESINFSSGSIDIGGTSYGTSKAYRLDDINANGLTVNSTTSLIGYISYGGKSGLSQLAPGTQPSPFSTTTSRYSNFELSYNGTAGGADLTNITAYGGSLKLAFLNGATEQGYVANTLNTGDMFRELAAAFGGVSSSAIVTDGNGKFLRAIGPNKFPASVSGSMAQNPYPSFNGYLKNLYQNSGNGTQFLGTKLTNLAPDADPGGNGATGTKSTSGADTNRVAQSTGFNLDYHFQAKVEQVEGESGSAPDGTYKVVFTGYVNATNQSNPSETYKYEGLEIVVNADEPGGSDPNLYMTNFLYLETIDGADVSVSASGWQDLVTDFGEGFTEGGLKLKVAGDFAQAILSGLVGSDVEINGKVIGEMSSYELWEKAALYAYGPAQPDDEFYSLWAQVVAENSEVQIPGGAFYDRLGVYGSPYDDRFGTNTISPNGDTTEMRITLLPDGSLSLVPEPDSWALGLGLFAGVFVLVRRRR